MFSSKLQKEQTLLFLADILEAERHMTSLTMPAASSIVSHCDSTVVDNSYLVVLRQRAQWKYSHTTTPFKGRTKQILKLRRDLFEAQWMNGLRIFVLLAPLSWRNHDCGNIRGFGPRLVCRLRPCVYVQYWRNHLRRDLIRRELA